ncbi:hypothetical protein [Rhizobium sp. NXC24]|uniref:hypothetical protein n=1 Tax=Rhizobium sp. NXC24 TaxID=2048897 RepID=UPI000CDF3A52|nr:hypothetical protein [Rhizobium sp. NXC24]AVA21185.1 hypothetical protein NXC24_CH01529 [Rhizobium sp. NXC24]
MPQLASNIWADGPYTDPYTPLKSDIRAWGTWLESLVNAFTSNGGLLYTSRAALYADLAHAAPAMAWVLGDATTAYNGIYVKAGASGSGSWSRAGDLPFSFIVAEDTGAGTPNAIQATSSIPISASALVVTNVYETNTLSPVTIQFNGGAILTVKTNSGNDIAAGGIPPILFGYVQGSTFRCVNDEVSAAIVAAAEAAQVAAEAAAAAAASSAASVNLPTSLVGHGGYYSRVKADASGREDVAPDVVQDAINTLTAIRMTGTWTPGAVPARFGKKMIAAANDTTLPEIGDYIELNQTVEPTGPAGTVYKVGHGVLVKSTATAPELYAANYITDGKGGPGYGTLYVQENDMNNRGAHADTLAAANGVYGYVAATGAMRGTAGFWSAGYFDASKYNYGFAAHGYHAKAGFIEATSAPSAYKVEGAHTYGLDMLGVAALNYTLALPNAVPMVQANSTGTLLSLLNLDATNILQLGHPAVGYIQTNQSILPVNDNAYQLGNSTHRFTTVWAVNGTIQTSDPRLKTDIEKLPDVWALFSAIDPITFKWESGGQEAYEVEEDGEVQATEEVEVTATEIVDGKAVEVTRKETRPVYDALPIHDADGNELFTVRPATTDKDGNIIREEQRIPRVHFVPRMVPGKVKRTATRDLPGKRTHWGFNAEEVKNAFDGLGIDFGGYVEDEDGTKGLRPDQLIPVLWKAVQDLNGIVDAQSAAIDAQAAAIAELTAFYSPLR